VWGGKPGALSGKNAFENKMRLRAGSIKNNVRGEIFLRWKLNCGSILRTDYGT